MFNNSSGNIPATVQEQESRKLGDFGILSRNQNVQRSSRCRSNWRI